MNPTGIITREYTVWCGVCGNWEQTAHAKDKAAAAKYFRKNGWSLTKASGWQCKVCPSRGGLRRHWRS